MKVLLALAFLLWHGADARYTPEQEVRYPPEHDEHRYRPEHRLHGSPFVTGKTHRYELTINITAGVPGLTNQVAKSLLQLDVSIRPETENEYLLKVEYVKVSESRSSVDSGDAPLPLRRYPELERDMTQPIRFTYEHGEVKFYTLGSTESLPSRSIKRSILRHFQMKLNPSVWNRRHEDYHHYYPVTYSTTESDEAGPYEAIYTVNVSPYPEFPYEENVYNITRVHNYEPYGYPAYYERHNFAKQGTPEVCRPGENPTHNPYGAGCPVGYEPHQTPLKASKVVNHNLRYIYGKYVLENVMVEEKSNAAVYDQDLVVSIESQYVLKEVSERRIEEPREDQTRYTELNTAPTEEELRREEPRGPEDVTYEHLFVHGIFDNVRASELVTIAERILEKVSTAVVAAEIEGVRAQEVSEDVSNLQDYLSLLKKTDLDVLYSKIPDFRNLRKVPEKEKVKRQIFLDVLPLAGTDDSIEYIKYLIRERRLSVWEAKEILEAIPSNLIKATEKNVRDLLELTELPYIRQHHILHSAAYLTLSNVIREAYVVPRFSAYHDKEDRYNYYNRREHGYGYHQETWKPRHYGRYYDEEQRYEREYYPSYYRRQEYRQRDETPRYDETTLWKYIQDLAHKLRSTNKLQEKVVYVEALAQTGHKKTLKFLEPYVYGYAPDTEEYYPADVEFLQTAVIYALHHVVEYYPEETQEIVAPVYFNRTEAPRVRIAAFSVLLRSQPSLAVFQHVAEDSHEEPSNEVGSYVYSALQTFGNASTPWLKPTAERIKQVFSQVKYYDIGAQYSKSIIKTFFDELHNFGLEKRIAVVQNDESIIPNSFYTALKYNFHSLRDILYQIKLDVQGFSVEDLLKDIDYEVLGLKIPHDIPQGVENHIFRGLKLLPRLPKELRIIFYKQIFYTSSYHYVDAHSIGSYMIPLLEHVSHYFSVERGSVGGHYVKTYIPSSYQSLAYSSVGFPVHFRMKHPLIFSLKVESRRPHRASSNAYAYYVRPSVYYGTYYKHSIFNTVAQHAYGVYQEQKYTATFPMELSVYYDDEASTFEVSYKLPEVPKRVYRYESEAGTYEADLKDYVRGLEENREPIRTIPALFQREQMVTGFPFPPLHLTYYTENIQDEHVEVPQNMYNVVELIVESFRNPGFRRRDLNATIVTRPSSPVDQVTFTFSYNRTYDAPDERYESYSTEQAAPEITVRTVPWSRHPKHVSIHQGRRPEDEYSVLSRIFPHRQVPEGEYEEITPEQAYKVYEAFSESLSNVAHEFYVKMETSPSVNVAELKVEYNHTFDKIIHSVRAELAAFDYETKVPYKAHLAHVTRYVYSPNAFHYEPRAYVGQYASFFHAITFGEYPKPHGQSDVIARGAFVKVPPEQHFSPEEFEEKPDHDAFTPEYREECERDVQEGKSQSPACIAAVEEDARLNKLYVRFTAQQDLPPVVLNFTYKLEDAIKYYYYDRVEVNSVRVHNPPRTVDVIVNYIDKLTVEPVLDVYVRKPHENVIYHKVGFKNFEPLSSVHTLYESHKLKSTNYTYPPSCSLMEKYVRTYDQEVYPLPRDSCTYVLSTHCTEKKKFTVLAKQVSASDDYKEVYMYVADKKVVLKPERSSPDAYYSIVYNEHLIEVKTPVLLDEEEELYVYPVRVYDERVRYILVVRADKAGIKVEYDGKNAKLQVSPLYKGELCGLCSEYDGETTHEYTGPDQCLYWDSEDFAHSSVINADTCGIRMEPKNPVLCHYGERRVHHRHQPYPPYAPYNYYSYGRSRHHDYEEHNAEYNYLNPNAYEKNYEGKPRRSYDERDETYKRSWYPYDEKHESFRKSRYSFPDKYESYRNYRYPYGVSFRKHRQPYDEQREYTRKYGYPYEEKDEYPYYDEAERYPYGDKFESYRKYRYPYYNQEEQYNKSHYPHYGNQEETYKTYRYPYDEQEKSYKKYDYPYGEQEDTYKKFRYPNDEQEESYKRSYYPHYYDQEYQYWRSRHPYAEVGEFSKKYGYPYGYKDEYSRKHYYPYGKQEDSYKKYRYPYVEQEESYKTRYPYDEQKESYKKYRYPYDEQDESYKTRYPHDEQEESYKNYRYPYDVQDKWYKKFGYPYDEQKESYKTRYPYDEQKESYKTRYPYDEQEESLKKYRYPYDEQVESYQKRYPYYDQEDSYRRSRYPYAEEDDFYKRYAYLHDYKGEYSKKYRFPYGEQEESYKTRYPYDEQKESYKTYRYPYDEQEESYKTRYPYDEQEESYKNYRYPYDVQEKWYKKYGYPYDEQKESYKTHYPYGEQEESYNKNRYPYDEQVESYQKSRYPYYAQEDSYRRSRYPYAEEDDFYKRYAYQHDYKGEHSKKYRYPYGEQEEYKKYRYPFDEREESYKIRYPYDGQKESYEKYRYPYDEQEESYKTRYPYDEQKESYNKYRYPYQEESYRRSRYPYDEEEVSYKNSRYPYHYDQEDSYRRSRYPYSKVDDFSKKYGYPYGYKDEFSRAYRYPYTVEEELYEKSHYPYYEQGKSYNRSRYPYDEQKESYRMSRYPYYGEDELYKKSHYPYYDQENVYRKPYYPYGEEDFSKKSEYPYGYKTEYSRKYRYPHEEEKKSYEKSRYPYDEQEESYRRSHYPYEEEKESYKKSSYPYYDQEDSYRKSRYPYAQDDDFYKKSGYPYGYKDEYSRRDRYPYDKQEESYSKSRYPYGDQKKEESYGESRYPYGHEDKSYHVPRHPQDYQDQSYGETTYPDTSRDQTYDESHYSKSEADDTYRMPGYPATSEDESYKMSHTPYADKKDEQNSYERDSTVKTQPKERTVYKQRGEHICFSTRPVPVCEEGYKPTEEYEISVGYHCLPKNDVTTKRLVEETKQRVLGEISAKKVDWTETYSAAKYCVVY